jgi:hypothetical protein
MTLDSWDIVQKIIVSVGGSGIIIAAIVKFAANQLANRISDKYKYELNTQIEKLKSDLSNKSHSYQAKFDKEFNLYGKLVANFLSMKKSVFWLFPIAFDHPPSDAQEKIKFYEKRYNDAYEDIEKARQSLGENAIFIPEDVFTLFDKVLTLCTTQYNLFPMCGQHIENMGSEERKISHECFKRTQEIQDEFNNLIGQLRTYIAQQLE